MLAPQHQYVISAGKKGDVCIFDVRQRTLRLKFQAHESAIKCLAVDPMEEFFVTGSADGDIKVIRGLRICFFFQQAFGIFNFFPVAVVVVDMEPCKHEFESHFVFFSRRTREIFLF